MAGVSSAINGGGVQAVAAAPQIDPGAEGGGGSGGMEAALEAAERTAGDLPSKLASEGITVTILALVGLFEAPKPLAEHTFLRAAYCMALFLLSCFGVALMVMSVWVSGDPPRRAAPAKTVMSATAVPLLLVLSLAALGTN